MTTPYGPTDTSALWARPSIGRRLSVGIERLVTAEVRRVDRANPSSAGPASGPAAGSPRRRSVTGRSAKFATTTTSSPGPPSCQRWKASSFACSSARRIAMCSPRSPRVVPPPPRRRAIRSWCSRRIPSWVPALRPVEGDGVVEPAILEQLLALEQHRDAGRRQDERRPERRPLLGPPAAGVAGLDRLGQAHPVVRDVVVRLGVDDPGQRRPAALAGDGRDHVADRALPVVAGLEGRPDAPDEADVPLRTEPGAALRRWAPRAWCRPGCPRRSSASTAGAPGSRR